MDPTDFPVSYLMTLIQKMVRSFQDKDVLTNPLPTYSGPGRVGRIKPTIVAAIHTIAATPSALSHPIS